MRQVQFLKEPIERNRAAAGRIDRKSDSGTEVGDGGGDHHLSSGFGADRAASANSAEAAWRSSSFNATARNAAQYPAAAGPNFASAHAVNFDSPRSAGSGSIDARSTSFSTC